MGCYTASTIDSVCADAFAESITLTPSTPIVHLLFSAFVPFNVSSHETDGGLYA
jgi:hypothetical protein